MYDEAVEVPVIEGGWRLLRRPLSTADVLLDPPDGIVGILRLGELETPIIVGDELDGSSFVFFIHTEEGVFVDFIFVDKTCKFLLFYEIVVVFESAEGVGIAVLPSLLVENLEVIQTQLDRPTDPASGGIAFGVYRFDAE